MDLSSYQCPKCGDHQWQISSTGWECTGCGRSYPCVNQIPKLYLESALGKQDANLRDYFYDGLLGSYYQYVMPFLLLPVRPARVYWRGWLAYFAIVLIIALAFGSLIRFLSTPSQLQFSFPLIIAGLACLAICYFLLRHPYLFYLLLLAVPVKLSVWFKGFKPAESFVDVHEAIVRELSHRKLQVLDISTGTCNSLYRHGWMQLDAEYTALDLSEKMLLQGQALMAARNIPVNFVLGDAARLPFRDDTFDVALNYGALNGYADPKQALEEMARVTRSGGLILFFDEQLYEEASFIERLYFKKVLSSHNVIHHGPVELLPSSVRDIRMRQVYQFYYLCTAHKK